MVEKASFANIKINVNGKIHNVKVEKGVTFNSCFVTEDNKCLQYIHDGNSSKHTLSIKYGNEIKMSKDEFTIFKNFANNVKENGNEIILSKADIKKAGELFRAGNFTNDISENLDGYADRRLQDIQDYDSLPQYKAYMEAKEEVIIANVDGKDMPYSTGDIHSEQVKGFVNESKNGKINYERDESGYGYYYTDKKGEKHNYVSEGNYTYIDYNY